MYLDGDSLTIYIYNLYTSLTIISMASNKASLANLTIFFFRNGGHLGWNFDQLDTFFNENHPNTFPAKYNLVQTGFSF